MILSLLVKKYLNQALDFIDKDDPYNFLKDWTYLKESAYLQESAYLRRHETQ